MVMMPVVVLAACGGSDSLAPHTPTGSRAAVTAAANSWLARADYPVNVYEAASAALTDSSTGRTTLYVIGGKPDRNLGAGNISSAVRAYDLSINAWRSRASLPVRLKGSNGAVAIAGKIYVSGGVTRRFDSVVGVYHLQDLKSLYVYDPANDTWSRKRDMPITTVHGLSASYQGLLYAATSCLTVSYCGEAFDSGALFRYNPANNTWVLLTRTPHDPWGGAGGFIGSKFYLVDELGDLDIYDVPSRAWSTGPKRPHRECAATSATLRAKLYIVGCPAEFDLSGVWPMLVFDPANEAWSEAAPPPIPAEGYWWTLSRVVQNGAPRLELIGGTKPGNNWRFVP
jgi:hypothetical protein